MGFGMDIKGRWDESETTASKRWVLPFIVVAQFACTSLWFAGNAIMPDLQMAYNLPSRSLGDLTAAVQLGFISGTMLFALFTVSDRYSPSKVFFVSAVTGALLNLSLLFASGFGTLLLLRMLTGFFLAGIYPVGMKIASDYHQQGLGKALGYLVGALVVGTAFPHLLKISLGSLPWKYVLFGTSGFALLGGILILAFVPNGPYRKPGNKVDFRLCFAVFKKKEFRAAAFGYFGHMWELYTFWAFVPVMLTWYGRHHANASVNVGLWSFLIIAIGGFSCVVGGYASKVVGSRKVAFLALLISGICCLLSVFMFMLPPILFYCFLLLWGMSVIADSPQFSTLVAQRAPKESTGTALTIVNTIGFAITIVSLQVINTLSVQFPSSGIFMVLALGPLLGLIALQSHAGQESSTA